MNILEVNVANLFMQGESRKSNPSSNGFIQNQTVIKLNQYVFEFTHPYVDPQQPVNPITQIQVRDFEDYELNEILKKIDNICLMLSLLTENRVHRINSTLNNNPINGTPFTQIPYGIAEIRSLIPTNKNGISDFITKYYKNFESLIEPRQLNIAIGYLCDAHTHTYYETKLIIHYVLIENLKHTFALEQGYKERGGKFSHPNYPDLNYLCPNKIEYCFDPNTGLWKHKIYGKCGSAEMTRRMFETAGIKRNNEILKRTLEKRNKMIHEGVLLEVGHLDYSKQAQEDFNTINDLIRNYLLRLIGYKGIYKLNKDRFKMNGLIQ